MKTIVILCVLVLAGATGRAYERLQGPTELLYWDRTQTYEGYTFFGARGTTYLLDMEGRVIHTWPVGANPRLLDDGHVLDVTGTATFVEVDWNGSNVWSHTEGRPGYFPHGDFLRIQNPKLGAATTLYLANKSVASNECIAAGCNPASSSYADVTVDAVVEVDAAGTVVWEWRFFDHGCQDFDVARSNYVATISNAPGRINLNLPGRPLTNDWLHCVSIDYNRDLDQIVIAAEGGEFYVIDHGNTFLPGNPAGSVALAAGPAGDFLYRFGDPARYDAGTAPAVLLNWTKSSMGHKQIGGVSQVTWIPTNVPGAGHFLVFNNGQDLFESTPQSYIFEVNGYLNAAGGDSGGYVNPPAAGYNTWAPPGHDTDKERKLLSRQVVSTFMSMANQAFFSHIGGSVQKLPNSNLLVCAATEGHIFEVTPASNVVWEYVSPVTTNGIAAYRRDNWPLYNAVYRATRYSPSHSAFAGHALAGSNTIAATGPTYLSAPAIGGIALIPAMPQATSTVTVSAAITNNRVVASATLTYIVGTSTNAVAMTATGGVYIATIPAFAAGTLVRYCVSAADDFGNTASIPIRAPAETLSYTVSGDGNLPPVILGVTQTPASPTHLDAVTIAVQATDDGGVASAVLDYGIGGGVTQTNTAFLETMATSVAKPWGGTGCDNRWTVAFKSTNPFEQAGNANYGGGNTNGLSFKNGTTNLADSSITTSNAINALGGAGTVTFYLQTSIVSGNAAWAMQLNPGTGFTTRLSGQTSTSQGWQLQSYALESGDFVTNLQMRFLFAEGNVSNRVFLDQIAVKVVTSTAVSSNVVMTQVGGDVYAAQIPPQTNGSTVSYTVTVRDAIGLSAATSGAYRVDDAWAYPVAAFSAAPTNGGAPLPVVFTDTSAGVITNRLWLFGDGGTMDTATDSVTHTYARPGTHTVQLVACGPLGSSTSTCVGLVVAIPVDTVGDGIPDWWRALWFGGNGGATNARSCAEGDPDSDGMRNGQEFVADTNPTNGASRLAVVGVVPEGGGTRITWIGGVEATQVVESRGELGPTQEPWAAVCTNAAPTAVTNAFLHPDGTTASNRFYRIRAWR